MPHSLSLTAYLAFAHRQASVLSEISRPRPEGEVIWLHCSEASRARAFARLGQRLADQRANATALLTVSPNQPEPTDLPPSVVLQRCPSENPGDIKKFLGHWRPDIGLWLGPWLRPALIDAARKRHVPLALLEADRPGVENRRWRWVPEPTKATLARFHNILALDDAAAGRIRWLVTGSATVVQTSGNLCEESTVLPCDETDLEDLRATIGARPVWLAARVQPQEIDTVIEAYRKVLRLTHRLLLIVVPDRPEDAAQIRNVLLQAGLRLAEWDDGVFPGENTHVLFSETPDELGLWYRVSPVTFMGASLVAGAGGRDPLETAALGSAVLYGPSVRNHLGAYSRLAQAGGARIVKDANSLAAALAQLTAPDQVAAMAHAGWQVVSEGAEVSDSVVALGHRLLDEWGTTR